MRLLRYDDLPVTPWKNGGGLTREIAVHLDREIHPEFLWRISMATVARPGPFSQFEGIDRTIAVLQGNGILLNSNGSEITLGHDSAPYSFSGETPIEATVIAGDTTDLNVMTRRGYFTHIMKRHVIRQSAAIDVECDDMILVFEGRVMARVGQDHFPAAPMDTLTGIRRGDRVDLSPEEETVIYTIELSGMTVGNVQPQGA